MKQLVFAIARDTKAPTKLKFLVGSTAFVAMGPNLHHVPYLINRLHELVSTPKAKGCPMNHHEIIALETFGTMLVQVVAMWRDETIKEWKTRPR